MSYQISNTGASIRFSSDQGFFFLMKNHIKSIRYVRDNMIRIETACCMHSIYLQADQVNDPVTNDAEQLATILNDWLGPYQQPTGPSPRKE